jgi:hypothetical protein
MYLQEIIDELTQLLAPKGKTPLRLADVIFARDDDVTYGTECQIHRSKLVEASRFDSFLPLFAGGPSWIHANLILSSVKPYLITIRTGSLVGNPSPSINVSVEKREVKILETGH